jgi:hypothetical protein
MLNDIYETLKQVLVITETQKRQEEDIKELKRFMIEVTTILQRLTDRVEMTDAHSKSDLENLERVCKPRSENSKSCKISGAQRLNRGLQTRS